MDRRRTHSRSTLSHKAILLVLLAHFHVSRAAIDASNPAAEPSATVIAKYARFTVLTPQLMRMEWNRAMQFRDEATMTALNRRLPVPAFEVQQNTSWMVITTSHLELSYEFTSDRSFYSGNLRVNSVDGSFVWTPGSLESDDEGRLPGTIRTLDGVDGPVDLSCDALAHRDDLHCTMGLVSRKGFVVVDDTLTVEFDESPWPWVKKQGKRAPPEEQCNMDQGERRQCGPGHFTQEDCEDEGCCFDDVISACFYSAAATQDLYFLGHGRGFKQALKEFALISGPVPLPPRFSFGVFFSHYWQFNDVGIEKVVQAFEQHTVPLDVVVIDMDWHTTFYGEQTVDQAGQKKGWTGFTWDKTLFPNPAQFIASLHARGLKVTLNLHPASGVQPWEESYDTVASLMGVDPASKRYVPFRITDKHFAEVWLNHTLGMREGEGVDFWWLDWQQGEGWIEVLESIHHLNPTIWLNYVFSTNPHRWSGTPARPLILHRWGGLGNHRYPLGFSGDVVPSWESLRFQPYFTAMAANVLYGYWSHDIGGHTAPTDAELYTRWVQWGALSPAFRTHCTKDPLIRRLVWKYEEPYAAIMMDAIALRASLLPYIYTQAWLAHTTGLAFVRGLYFDFPDFEESFSFSHSQYMFGDSLMVAPVTTPRSSITGLADLTIWVPPGCWIDVVAGTRLDGPLQTQLAYSQREIPLFAPCGVIVPRKGAYAPAGGVLGSSQELSRTIRLWVMPGAKDGVGMVYEDDGESSAYLTGEGATRTFRYQYSQHMDALTLVVEPVDGVFRGMPQHRNLQVDFVASWPADTVAVNGEELQHRPAGRGRLPEGEAGWAYDGATLTLTVFTGFLDVTGTVTVEIGLMLANDHPLLLSGFIGNSARLQTAKEALDDEFGKVYMDWYPTLLAASAAASRITYDPFSAHDELSWFDTVCAAGLAEVSKLKALDDGVKTKILALFKCRNNRLLEGPETDAVA